VKNKEILKIHHLQTMAVMLGIQCQEVKNGKLEDFNFKRLKTCIGFQKEVISRTYLQCVASFGLGKHKRKR
jgi:hypothetical protein